MKRIVFLLLFFAFSASVFAQSDEDGVRDAVTDYLEGLYQAEPERHGCTGPDTAGWEGPIASAHHGCVYLALEIVIESCRAACNRRGTHESPDKKGEIVHATLRQRKAEGGGDQHHSDDAGLGKL